MQNTKEITVGLKKVQGHLSKVVKMIDNKEYCIDIMQQVLAIIGLLKSANQKLLANHLNHCFANAMKINNEKKKKEMIAEILHLQKICSN